MKALVLTPRTREVQVRDIAKPTPGPKQLLIRVHAVALNPVDALYVNSPIAVQERRVVGTDFAGLVVEVGAGVQAISGDARVKIGARVAGFLQGACSVNDRPGAFAEFVTAESDLVWAIPDSLSLEEAAAVSMCGLTAAQAIFSRLGLPCPFDPERESVSLPDGPDRDREAPVNVLIYGSSTSVGLYAAQLHGLLSRAPYSYDLLVDYRDPGWTQEARCATGGEGIDLALDCISEGATLLQVDSTLASGGRLAVIRGPAGGKYDPSELRAKPLYGAAWEGLGVEIGYNGFTIPASQTARDFAVRFYEYLGSGAVTHRVKLQPNPIRVMPGGLERVVPDGFTLLGSPMVSERFVCAREEEYMRPISGEKLVYRI